MRSSCIPSWPSENICHFIGQIFYIAWAPWGSVFDWYRLWYGFAWLFGIRSVDTFVRGRCGCEGCRQDRTRPLSQSPWRCRCSWLSPRWQWRCPRGALRAARTASRRVSPEWSACAWLSVGTRGRQDNTPSCLKFSIIVTKEAWSVISATILIWNLFWKMKLMWLLRYFWLLCFVQVSSYSAFVPCIYINLDDFTGSFKLNDLFDPFII